MHNARQSPQDVWPDTIESKLVRCLMQCLLQRNILERCRNVSIPLGMPVLGRNAHCSYTNLSKQDHYEILFPS